MKPNQFIGLIKFFANEDHLDNLIKGCFHCTPPEVYRLGKREGVSDKFESCMHSYRVERNDAPTTLELNGFEINDALEITIYNKQNQDSWMHCWFSLRFPKDEEALQTLKSHIAKMKQEFGHNFAFLLAPQLKSFIKRLQELGDKTFSCGEVEYSGDRSKWGNLCKAIEYSYQREYRFMYGECSTSETEFYVLNDPQGFGQYIHKNPEFKIMSKDKKVTWFDLSA